MKLPITSFVFFSVVVISLLVYGHAAISIITDYELVEGGEEEFNYIQGDERGPNNWGNLRKDWKTCRTGKKQSPIDIPFEDVEFMNSAGQVSWPGSNAGSLTINGRRYFLQQSHWHSPSEHTINGRRFDLELHVVHKNPSNKRIAVFSILYNIGWPDAFLSKLLPYISSLKDQTTNKVAIRGLDPNLIGVDPKIFYRYNGSLTTPPCSENIRSVSLKQLYTLKAAVVHYKSNARPLLQPLNQRAIKLFYPMPYQEYASY